MKYAVGVDLGGTTIKIGLVSQSGKIIKKIAVSTEAEYGSRKVICNIKEGIKKLLSVSNVQVEGIGIGCPGVVNSQRGTVENPPNFKGWKKVNVGRPLSMEFETDVYVENDANAAAIGELVFGSGQKYSSFVMITLGTGVGGGIVINRKLYYGDFGAAGEIGHITIDHNGPKCNCGSFGCIEAYAGSNYLRKRVWDGLKQHPRSLINKLIEKNYDHLTPRKIKEAADKGDKFAISIIEDLGVKLGAAFASVSNLIDVSTYIVGGGVAGFGKPLFNSIQKTFSSRVLKSLQPRAKVISAQLKNEAGIKGASALVFHGY